MWYLPILNQPVQFHSSRDPGTCNLTPEQCAYKSQYWVFWYEADLVYALPTVYFFVSAIALFAIARFTSDYAPERLTGSAAWRRSVSALRFLSYKSWRAGSWNSQPLGVFLLGAVGAVFLGALTLGPRPYYWPTDAHYGNSPPIATRTGWLALACVPFVLALGAKANMVSALTGVPPEQLNVWHNWISWAMFVLALIHTFPFIVFHNRAGDTAMVFRDGGVWLAGVIALVAQAWLTFMSISWIRNRWYEFFKATHYFFAAAFLVFFFLHCSFRLTSWDYFIAMGAIYLASLSYAVGKTWFKYGIRHTARLRLETPDSLRIAVQTKSSWRPGQHVYLRFLTCGVHVLTSHPLTVCSLPGADARGGELIFHVQPRGGLTRRLASLAKKQPDAGVKVLLEGPYGGLPMRWSKGFDRTLVVAGGSGCGLTLSLIEDWLRNRGASSGGDLKVVLATRDPEMPIWYMEELQHMAERQRGTNLADIPGLSIALYETHASPAASPVTHSGFASSGDDDEKRQQQPRLREDSNSTASLFSIKFFRGRPDTGSAVRELSLQGPHGSVGVAVCGPSGMVHDVAAEAAAQQQRIVRGQSGASEVWFHKEAFS
ncbi:Flavoprotein transmembrane component [Tolypocladium paradoxum]|uniref:ferric-chelate reductase (NADPH) n=1 Tax=Tolypocladium paradoxum TaxID=94208 RepID=A0A2S4KM62_9HYPO|nr:Flavoprotein transmembrane component [Tolypocladium paradoxum]